MIFSFRFCSTLVFLTATLSSSFRWAGSHKIVKIHNIKLIERVVRESVELSSVSRSMNQVGHGVIRAPSFSPTKSTTHDLARGAGCRGEEAVDRGGVLAEFGNIVPDALSQGRGTSGNRPSNVRWKPTAGPARCRHCHRAMPEVWLNRPSRRRLSCFRFGPTQDCRPALWSRLRSRHRPATSSLDSFFYDFLRYSTTKRRK